MKLTPIPPVRYTITETQFFDSIPKSGKKVGSQDILAARLKLGDWDVKYPLKNISVTMSRLMDKIDTNGEPFRLRREDKAPGHANVEYWLEACEPGKRPMRNQMRRARKRKANGK